MMKVGMYELDRPPKSWNVVLDDKPKPLQKGRNRDQNQAVGLNFKPRNSPGPRSPTPPKEPKRKTQQSSSDTIARSSAPPNELKRKLSPTKQSRPPAKKRPKSSKELDVEAKLNVGLETTEEKERYFDLGQVVYAEFPDDRLYYWGSLVQKFAPQAGRRMEFQVLFEDGDRATLDCSRMQSYDEVMHLMENKFMAKNLPNPQWLAKQQASRSKKKQSGSSFNPIRL
jgi:hypothetical protein